MSEPKPITLEQWRHRAAEISQAHTALIAEELAAESGPPRSWLSRVIDEAAYRLGTAWDVIRGRHDCGDGR